MVSTVKFNTDLRFIKIYAYMAFIVLISFLRSVTSCLYFYFIIYIDYYSSSIVYGIFHNIQAERGCQSVNSFFGSIFPQGGVDEKQCLASLLAACHRSAKPGEKTILS